MCKGKGTGKGQGKGKGKGNLSYLVLSIISISTFPCSVRALRNTVLVLVVG